MTTSVELIDLRSIVPWDKAAIEESVRKTRRLVVVQEDTENCSVGQMIISHVTGTAGTLEHDDQSADSREQSQRHDRLQSDLRIRRVARRRAHRRRDQAIRFNETRARDRCSRGRDCGRMRAKKLSLRLRTARHYGRKSTCRNNARKASPFRSWAKEFATRKLFRF